MNSLQSLLQEIDILYQELQEMKPLKKEDEDRLWKKLRLEWNYNSNHMEGNTLTYGQTELLLMFDKVTGDHDVRELEEMKAHDVVIKLIREYAANKARELTEADIRQWNQTILVRPFWSDAQTQSGQPTRKLITPGEYKKEPNSVLLANGEMFHYSSPEETPIQMRELVEWYRKEAAAGKLHPVELAALMHYKFVRIHPFDDSNGRTARLLMNFILLKYDYPPVVIKSADKKNYLFALNKADVGDLNAFVEYIAQQLIWSLQLNIRAGRGLNIDESDDIDKEIAIWKRGKNKESNQPIKKDIIEIKKIYHQSLVYLFTLYNNKYNQFAEVFRYKKMIVQLHGNFNLNKEVTDLDEALELFNEFLDKFSPGKKDIVTIILNYENLKSSETLIIINSYLAVEFHDDYYLISNGLISKKKYYGEYFTEIECQEIIADGLKRTFTDLKNQENNK